MDQKDAHVPAGDVEKNGTFYVEDVAKAEAASPAASGHSRPLDSEDEPKMTVRRFMPLVAMAFLWTGSQIPLYLYGAIPPYIYGDIGGVDRWIWFVLANLLALAAICPFVGSLSDLFGRRYTAMTGAVFLIIGNIVTSTSHTMNIFIGGMALAGIGAGILELTALAVTSEIAPTRKRGKYNAWMIFIKREPRILLLTLIITFISGANFFSVLLFWPTQSYNSYGHEPTAVGVRNITLGFSILAGACIVLALLTYTRGHIRLLMLGSCVFMTAGGGGMAALRTDNIWLVYVVLTIAGLGIGGIVVPASIITNIICPDEVIATVTALTLAIRVLGGAIGYCIYYNVFAQKFAHAASELILVPTAAVTLQTKDPEILTKVVEITVAGLLDMFYEFPNITETQVQTLIHAGQETYAYAYPYVYYVSIAFGGVSIICSLFLGNIKKYMTDKVAVSM
ncbi:hypothetical protein SLS54_002309 [Diplodia seriata]